MISSRVLDFLRLLKENNNREWFLSNKHLYNEAKNEFELFVEKLIIGTSLFDRDIGYLTIKDCTYRIHRDTRFSSDKTPYKINFGAYLVKGGKSSGNAGYYFHLEPNNSLIAGGVYMPVPEILKKIRQSVFYNIEEFLEIINDNNFKRLFPILDDDSVLKKYPLGFPKDFEYMEYLKYKSYTVSIPLKDEEVTSHEILGKTLKIFKILKPFNDFFNSAIEEG